MKQLFANQIIEQDGIMHALVVLDRTVKENLKIVFPGKKYDIIQSIIKMNPPEGFHTLDRYCQYVVLTQMQSDLGMSMKISDYHNNLDLALDEYKKLFDKGWDKKLLDKIMKIFQEIEKDQNNIAEIIIKDPVD